MSLMISGPSTLQPYPLKDTLPIGALTTFSETPPRPAPTVAGAIVYCEANFGAIDGKTANGLVRHTQKYEILSVIDSCKAGLDAGTVLDRGRCWLQSVSTSLTSPFVAQVMKTRISLHRVPAAMH